MKILITSLLVLVWFGTPLLEVLTEKENPWADPLNPPTAQEFQKLRYDAMRSDLKRNCPTMTDAELDYWLDHLSH